MSSGPYLKSNAPASFQDHVSRLETLCDESFTQLSLLKRSRGEALWAILTGVVGHIEAARKACNGDTQSKQFNNAVITWIPAGGWACKKAIELCPGSVVDLQMLNWSSLLAKEAYEALDAARKYHICTGHFPPWHENKYAVELAETNKLTFYPQVSEVERRVIAFRQGYRHPEWLLDREPLSGRSLTLEQEILFRKVLEQVKAGGDYSPFSKETLQLYKQLKTRQRTRLEETRRWNDETKLGEYSLKEFREVYSALLSVANVHEMLCLQSQNQDGYPLRSYLLIRTLKSWSRLLSQVSGIAHTTTSTIISQLRFRPSRTPDLCVTPFVNLGDPLESLAVVPHAILASKVEDNVIRVFSKENKPAYDALSTEKHDEALRGLVGSLPSGTTSHTCVRLTEKLPDIDLLAEETAESCLLVSEVKWERNPVDYYETQDRDKGFAKGQAQLQKIEEFLREHPNELQKRGLISRPLTCYPRIYFVLIGRDHFVWPKPGQKSVVEYEVFKLALRQSQSLVNAIESTVNGDWLPRENIDYVVSRAAEMLNKVVLDVPDHRPTH